MVLVIVQPTPLGIIGGHGMWFTFGGYFRAYRVDSQPQTPSSLHPGFAEAVLQRSGRLALKFERLEDAVFFKNFLRQHRSKLPGK